MTDSKSDRWSVRGPLIGGFLVLAVLVGGFGTWAAVTRITGAVIAPGRIEVDQNRQVVQHPDGGVVAEILVKEGDSVAEGDLLVRLDPVELQSELAVVEGQLFEVLARRARFEAERDSAAALVFDPLIATSDNPVAAELMEGQQRLFEARLDSAEAEKDQLSKRRDQIRDQIIGIQAQQEATAEQLRLIEQELADQQTLLDRGLAQSTRVLALQREMANLTGQAGELTAAVAQAEGRITETEIEILRIETTPARKPSPACATFSSTRSNWPNSAARSSPAGPAGYPRPGVGRGLWHAGLCPAVGDPGRRSCSFPDPAGPAPCHHDPDFADPHRPDPYGARGRRAFHRL